MFLLLIFLLLLFSKETKAIGTRNHSEIVLNALAASFPEVVGGSADLTPSNLTNLKVFKLLSLIIFYIILF